MYRLSRCRSDRYAIHRHTIVPARSSRYGESERAGGHALGKEQRFGFIRARTNGAKTSVLQGVCDCIGNRTTACFRMWSADDLGNVAFEQFEREPKMSIAIGGDDGAKFGADKPRVVTFSIQGRPDAIRESVRQ